MRRVVRVSSLTPRCCSRSVTWREISARDRPRVLAASEKLPSLMTSTKLCMVRKRSMARSISQPSATLSLTFALFSEQIRKSNVCFRRLLIQAKSRARQSNRVLVKRRFQSLLMYSRRSNMTKRRMGKGNWGAAVVAGCYFFCLFAPAMAIGAEPLKRMRVAIPSIVIDFAPLWIAREKGLFREERIEVEITYIQGNIRGVQSLLAGEVQAGIAGSAGPIGARAAGEDAVIVAVPMNRLDYTFVARQPVKSAADLAGKKIGIGAVGGSDEVATSIALRHLGVDQKQVTMLVTGGSAERLAALRVGSVDAATVGGATFIGGGAGLYKVLDLVDLGVEFPFTAIFTTRRYAQANRDAVLALIRGYMRGVKFFQQNKEESIAITARNLRNPNMELLERQWQYVKDHVYEKVPLPTEKGFKLVFDMLAPRNLKVDSLRLEDVFVESFVK